MLLRYWHFLQPGNLKRDPKQKHMVQRSLTEMEMKPVSGEYK